jgi:hypothetical protein
MIYIYIYIYICQLSQVIKNTYITTITTNILSLITFESYPILRMINSTRLKNIKKVRIKTNNNK